MGWLHPHGISKSDLIKDLTDTKEWTNKDGDKILRETPRHCCKGNTLWSIYVIYKNDQEVARFINCTRLRSHESSWGYKDIDEAMGPCYYDCPISYLDLAPVEDPEWREQVRIYHKKQSRKVELNKTYKLVNAKGLNSVKILSLRPLKGIANNGRTYRIPKRMIGEELAS